MTSCDIFLWILVQKFSKTNGLGILLCIGIASLATFLGGLSIGSFSFEIIGAPVFAILIGMIITLIMPTLAAKDSTKSGIKFTSKKILQWAVILFPYYSSMKQFQIISL